MTTLPDTSPTGTTAAPSGSQPSGTSTSPPGSAEFPYPTSTGTTPPGNNNGNGNNGNDNGNPSDPNDPSGGSDGGNNHTTAIAVGTVFGVIALMVGAAGAAWYMRNRRSQESFHLLSNPGDDDDEGSHLERAIPIAGGVGTMREKGLPMPPLVRNVKDKLSTLVPGQHVQMDQSRRDMLADEDTRVFENERSGLWGTSLMRDTSSGRSSFKRPSIGDRVYGSLVSLRNVGGAMLDYASGTIKKEGSTGSKSTGWRREKEPTDPFSDDWGLIKPSLRPRGGRQGSEYTYTDPYDPFEDYDVESLKIDNDHGYHDHPDSDTEYHPPALNDAPPRPYLHVPAQLDLSRLTPLSERLSLSTVTEQSVPTPSDSSQSMPLSPFATIGPGSSSSSHEPPLSPRRPTSIIDANPTPSSPMHRSNSWWSRFYKTPLLDRRSSETRLQNVPTDFRDPNPPPSRLNPIEEAHSPESPSTRHRGSGSKESSGGTPGHTKVFSTHQHGRSASSLQTSKTANSETIERMGRSYDIVMRGTMSSHESGASMSSSVDVDEVGTELGHAAKPLSIVTSHSSEGGGNSDLHFVQSPDQLPSAGGYGPPFSWSTPTVGNVQRDQTPSPPRRPSPPQRVSTGGKVSERIQMYERRMSQQEILKSPPAVKSTKRIQYGLIPRPSLFVANPDRSRSSSADS